VFNVEQFFFAFRSSLSIVKNLARVRIDASCFLGQPPRRVPAIHTVSVEKSVEKIAQLPRCYEHSECFSGLHHSRATLT
jgi:hypothetical protein